jgi:hypothetical protein
MPATWAQCGRVGTGLVRLVQRPGRAQHQQPGLVDLQARLGQPVLQVGALGQRMAEGAPLQQPLGGQRQRQFALADAAHAVVHPARPQPGLGQRKALAPAAQQMVLRHAHAAQQQLAMALGRLVLQHRDVAQPLQARAGQRHQHHAVAAVRIGRRGLAIVGMAAHHDQQPALRVRGAGDEPLAPMQHQAVALAPHRGLQVGGVARGHVGLGHRKGRADLAAQQRRQPALALGGLAKRCSSSMLPLSGAWQLNTSAAQGRRPMASASGA